MKIKQYTKEQLEQKISDLERMQGTKLQKPTDKKYIREYKSQLAILQNKAV